MPFPIAAALSAGGNILSQGINAAVQSGMNRKTRKWNEHMYNIQRGHALEDWNRQNAYDHPSAQMARFKDAGLNPHLIYGQQTQSPSVRSTDVKSWSPEAPQFDLGSTSGQYFNTQIQQAQIDNLREDNRLKQAQALATLASAEKTEVDMHSTEFDLAIKQLLKDITIESAETGLDQQKSNLALSKIGYRKVAEEIRKTRIDSKVALDRNEREAAMNSQSIRESIQRILNMREQNAKSQAERQVIGKQLQLLDSDIVIRALDENMKHREHDEYVDAGINKNDPPILRWVQRGLKWLSDMVTP